MTDDEPGKQELPADTAWRLRRADGFMDLHMTADARRELDAVSVSLPAHPIVLNLRLRLAMEERDWMTARQWAARLCDLEPREPAYWVEMAYATRRSETVAAARTILVEAARRFPCEAIIPFNLACYECRLGHPEQAMAYLKQALSLNPALQQVAAEDDDLEPLWDQLAPD